MSLLHLGHPLAERDEVTVAAAELPARSEPGQQLSRVGGARREDMKLKAERVALPQGAVDLHDVGQDQRGHRHADQRIHQVDEPIGVCRGLEVAGADDRHAAATGVERGEKVRGCRAAGRLHAGPEPGMDDEPGAEGQADGPEQDVEEEDDGSAEGQHCPAVRPGRLGGAAKGHPGEMRDPFGNQAGADAGVENGQEDVEENDPHHEDARRAFENGHHDQPVARSCAP